jgi:hypothetical protein
MVASLRFLESIDNLKPRVRLRFGREPSTETAREIIACCLLQGRLFYEAASSAPLEIRPLQLFYGMVGFSKALIVASRCKSLSTLRPAHGLKDVSAKGCRIAELRVRIDGAGTFQEFNDVIAALTRFCYHEDSQPRSLLTPAAPSAQLQDLVVGLEDILGRIPGLEGLFRMTFGHDANTAPVNFFLDRVGGCQIRIDDQEKFVDRDSLKAIVMRWRQRFPFLEHWRLVEAVHAWGNSVIQLQNTSNRNIDEFSVAALTDLKGSFLASPHTMEPQDTFPFSQHLGPFGGGYSGGCEYPIAPVCGRYLSEFSLHYLGLFLLSSLVRYRPQTWVHALSRASTAQAPADDRALSLIERFLELNSGSIPSMVATVLSPQEDTYLT